MVENGWFWSLWLVWSWYCLVTAASFLLEGSHHSYASFPKWNATLNSTLELEFQTQQPNGLLLYTDDGGTLDFFELKLVEGALRLRFNLGGGAQILTVGRSLNDNRWHKVEIKRQNDQTSLSVDQVSVSRTSRGKEYKFGNASTNSFVYIGGLPGWYANKLGQLALPSVLFEPRFAGAIRNLIYVDVTDGLLRRQEMIASKGVRLSSMEVCEGHDPCQHGGLCISTDTGPICDCRMVDYEGNFCEKEKAPAEATFRGIDYLTYDLSLHSAEPIVSTTDEISLYFKTRQSNGLLFYTGDGDDYLVLYLRDGAVGLSVAVGSGRLDNSQTQLPKLRFDDNQWHRVVVHRKAQEISGATSLCHLSMTVDGLQPERWTAAGTFSMFSASRVYVGGADQQTQLPGLNGKANFIGCLRKVEFTADSLRMPLLELAQSGYPLLKVHGQPEWMCQSVEAADPVTFTTPDSLLVLPSWEGTRTGSLSLKVRTTEPNGLLLYNNGAATSQGDFFALELVGGHIFLHIDLGSGSLKVKCTLRRIDDGTWHEMALSRTGKAGRVIVDGAATDFVTPGDSHQLDLEGSLLVGGLGPAAALDTAALPPPLWTAALRQGFVGCMRDLVLNNQAMDLAALARQQDSGSVRPGCHRLPPQCGSQPCLQGGMCTEGWNRFLCDCTKTTYTGPTCAKDAATLSFDGSQTLRAALPSVSRTEAEDVFLRLKTPKPSGFVFSAVTEGRGQDRLELVLDNGRAKLTYTMGEKVKNWWTGLGLNDNQWHSVRITRRGPNLRFQVDEESPVLVEIPGKSSLLEVKTLHVGSSSTSGYTPFVGQIQHLTFNSLQVLELVRAGQFNVQNLTAKFGRGDQALYKPVHFKSRYAYLGLPQLKAYSSINIYFQFKTLQPNGLIMYNAGKGQDFIAVELVNGHIQYSFNLGDRPIRLRDNARYTLNDNRWHSVTIGRPKAKEHSLMIDDSLATALAQGSNDKLDLHGILYLGGVRKDMYDVLPRPVQSRQGFEGCLASLDLNGESPDPILDALVPSALVVHGCEGGGTRCSASACSHGGTCLQQWNSFACDCTMTSYTGPTCTDESVAYEFGPGPGLITYTYPEDRRTDSKSDLLSLGILTLQENGVIFRVTSSTSNDYLELELVDGNLFVVYNMGREDHPLGEMNLKVNDGEYHIIRVTRSGSNATLQVDDYNVLTKTPAGQQLSVFNSQWQLQVGGRWDPARETVERHFQGVVAGLVFKGIRVLDLASEKDPRVTVRGSANLLASIPSDYKQRHPDLPMQQQPDATPGVFDDLIFSGSGCPPLNIDDECVPSFNSGTGDDLITPVYIPPTRPPKPKTKPEVNVYERPCDDEDCFASGAGPDDTGTDTDDLEVTELPQTRLPDFSVTRHTWQNSSSDKTTGAVETTSLSTRHAPSSPSTTSTRTVPTMQNIWPSLPTLLPQRTRRPPKVSEDLNVIWEETRRREEMKQRNEELQRRAEEERNMRKKLERISSEAAENTALIIGIIAGALIAIILIVLLVLKFKNRSDGAYKVDESKNFRKPPHSASHAALLTYGGGVAPSGASTGVKVPPVASAPTTMDRKPPPKKNGKDVKEWYV